MMGMNHLPIHKLLEGDQKNARGPQGLTKINIEHMHISNHHFFSETARL